MNHYRNEKPSIEELHQELEVSLKAWDLLVGERDHFYDQYVAGQQEIAKLQSTLEQNRAEMQDLKKDLEGKIKSYTGAQENAQNLRRENDTLQEELKKYTPKEDQTLENKSMNTALGNVSRKMYAYCRNHYLLSIGISTVVCLALGVYIGPLFTSGYTYSKSASPSAPALSHPEKSGKEEVAPPSSLPPNLNLYFSHDAGLYRSVEDQITEFEELNAFAKAHPFLPSAQTRVAGSQPRRSKNSSPVSSSRDAGLEAAPDPSSPPLPSSRDAGLETAPDSSSPPVSSISEDAGLEASPESGNPPASAAPLPPSPSEITPTNPTP